MKKLAPKIVFSAICLAAISACKPNATFDETPFLEFRGYELILDSDPTSNRASLVHELYFTDGDGDIGTSEVADTTYTCEQRLALNNLFVKYFVRNGGVYEELTPTDSCFPFASSIPDITPSGSNPTLEGTIYYEFDPTFTVPTDSVRFEFILLDRSGKESNIASTPALLLEP